MLALFSTFPRTTFFLSASTASSLSALQPPLCCEQLTSGCVPLISKTLLIAFISTSEKFSVPFSPLCSSRKYHLIVLLAPFMLGYVTFFPKEPSALGLEIVTLKPRIPPAEFPKGPYLDLFSICSTSMTCPPLFCRISHALFPLMTLSCLLRITPSKLEYIT